MEFEWEKEYVVHNIQDKDYFVEEHTKGGKSD
jgi:hypothetical protein